MPKRNSYRMVLPPPQPVASVPTNPSRYMSQGPTRSSTKQSGGRQVILRCAEHRTQDAKVRRTPSRTGGVWNRRDPSPQTGKAQEAALGLAAQHTPCPPAAFAFHMRVMRTARKEGANLFVASEDVKSLGLQCAVPFSVSNSGGPARCVLMSFLRGAFVSFSRLHSYSLYLHCTYGGCSAWRRR